MAVVKYYVEPTHEQQQYDKTHEAALKVFENENIADHLSKLGIDTKFIAQSIALESVYSLHNDFQGDRKQYIKKMNSGYIAARNKDIQDKSNSVEYLVKKYDLSLSQVNKIRAMKTD